MTGLHHTPTHGRQARPLEGTGWAGLPEEEASWLGELVPEPAAVRVSLARGEERAAVQLALRQGIADLRRLTDVVFQGRHPERGGRPVGRGEQALVREWFSIRDHVVKPLMTPGAAGEIAASPAAASAAFRPVPVESPGGGRVRNKRDPGTNDVVTVRGAHGPVPLHRLAAKAWEAMVSAARADGITEPLLLPVSGYRSSARQARLWQKALARYGSPEKAREWVAPPGGSAHHSGRAIDLYLGARNDSSNVPRLRRQPAYRWLLANGARFGFYPYAREPWHWEYNPPVEPQHEAEGPGAEAELDAPPSAAEFELGWLSLAKFGAPTLSPLVVSAGPLRKGRTRKLPVYGLCVHTTSGGPARKAAKSKGRLTALQIALKFYRRGREGFPHYVIDYDGGIHAVCDEGQIASHAGWSSLGRKRWASWKAPGWWSSVWSKWNAKTPADLLPPKASSPNGVYIGVELLADATGWGFTPKQYDALARLALDVSQRNGFTIPSAPSPRLLGHEDVEPITRETKGVGGWDPGAHRKDAKFSWSTLWSRMQALGVPAAAGGSSHELEQWELEEEIPSAGLEWPGALADRLAFMRRVYDRHVERSKRAGGSFVGDLPESRLAPIEGGHRARKEAAAAARALLAEARAALVAEGLAGRIRIGIVSSYRSAGHQFLIWQGKGRSGGFPYYYRQLVRQGRLREGDYSPRAVEIAAAWMAKYIAAPGFSNHQDGLAIDFGTGAGPRGDLGKIGEKAWFHKWLVANAARFGFQPYSEETWHWTYRGPLEREAWLGEVGVPGVRAGRLEVSRVPVLAAHRGKPPGLVLRWNEMSSVPAQIDVVVHLHGYSRAGYTLPRDIEPYSGLDLAPVEFAAGTGRRRPTLTVLPRANFTSVKQRGGNLYVTTFPALDGTDGKRDGLARLVQLSLERFTAAAGGGSSPRVARLILTAHSGGGQPLLRMLRFVDPHEVHVFDALYWDPAPLAEWARKHIRQDRAGGGPGGAGALRVFYGPGTRRLSRPLADAIAAEAGPLGNRYRVEASPLGHWEIPRTYGWRVLADASADVPRAARERAGVRRELELEIPSGPSVLDWPRILPVAKRDRRTAIRIRKGDTFATIPEIPRVELNAEQRGFLEQIKANRHALPDYPLKRTSYKGNKGYVLGDSGAHERLVPTELKTASTDPETRAKRVAWAELGHEGTLDSINTYDDQILTWGKGFSARSGSMNEVLMIMFRSDPEARRVLLRAGIDCDRHPRSWKVVNGQTGMVETGENALRLLRFDPKLLGVFVFLGRDPRHRQHALDAQWQAMSGPRKAARVPQYAWGWPEPAIALAAHLSHWTPAFGWGRNDYSRTGGDFVNIAGRWARAASSIPKWAKTLPNGAIVAPPDIMQPGHRLLGFAGGAGGRAIQQDAKGGRRVAIVSGALADLGADRRYAGHVLLPVYGTANRYYDLGSAGS